MEAETQIAEAVCDVAEELLQRKLRQPGLGVVSATRTQEAPMEGFNETDANNLQRVKDAMAERAANGGALGSPDAAAAAAFAALLDAETRRAEFHRKSAGQEKTAGAGASWTESVTPRSSNSEALAAAA